MPEVVTGNDKNRLQSQKPHTFVIEKQIPIVQLQRGNQTVHPLGNRDSRFNIKYEVHTMITAEELEMFIDDLIDRQCGSDSCPIDFGEGNDSK